MTEGEGEDDKKEDDRWKVRFFSFLEIGVRKVALLPGLVNTRSFYLRERGLRVSRKIFVQFLFS